MEQITKMFHDDGEIRSPVGEAAEGDRSAELAPNVRGKGPWDIEEHLGSSNRSKSAIVKARELTSDIWNPVPSP